MLSNALLSSLLCNCRGITPTVFYLTLNILFAEISENPEEAETARNQVPKDKKREVEVKVMAIRQYFNDPRYCLLGQGPAIWGLIVNAIKVACNVEVPKRQRELCQFDPEEIVAFLNELLQHWTLRKEVYSACNIGSADFQLLRVLMTANILDLSSLATVTKFFSDEGPSELKQLPPEVATVIHVTRFDPPGSGTYRAHGRI